MMPDRSTSSATTPTIADANLLAARDTAILAVSRASEVCGRIQAELRAADRLDKRDGSPVTVADFAAQAIVGHYLRHAHPQWPMVAEEDVATLETPENADLKARVVAAVSGLLGDELDEKAIVAGIRHGGHHDPAPDECFWTLDPVDGTKGFVRGDQYSVCLALIDHGHVVLAVMGCPNQPHEFANAAGPRGFITSAVRGHGATWRPLDDDDRTATTDRPMGVSATAALSAAVLADSVEANHAALDRFASAFHAAGFPGTAVRVDGQGKYAMIGMGQADVFVRPPHQRGKAENIWDHASGVLLVEEAGGCVTDFDGRPLDFSRGDQLRANAGIVASNGHFHAALLDLLRHATHGESPK